LTVQGLIICSSSWWWFQEHQERQPVSDGNNSGWEIDTCLLHSGRLFYLILHCSVWPQMGLFL